MDARGDEAMGFRHDVTTHHFRLRADGGAIEVSANDPTDTLSIAQIRGHLRQIAAMFAEGDFQIPARVHAQVPPGAARMKRFKDEIHYVYEPLEDGAQVRIAAHSSRATEAVHDFLRFQIREHTTGDPETIR